MGKFECNFIPAWRKNTDRNSRHPIGHACRSAGLSSSRSSEVKSHDVTLGGKRGWILFKPPLQRREFAAVTSEQKDGLIRWNKHAKKDKKENSNATTLLASLNKLNMLDVKPDTRWNTLPLNWPVSCFYSQVIGGMPIKVMVAEPKVRKGSRGKKTDVAVVLSINKQRNKQVNGCIPLN